MENNKKSFKKNKTYMNAREMIATAEDIRNGGCGCGCGSSDKTKKLTKKDIFVINKRK
jgi:hypothetical protein